MRNYWTTRRRMRYWTIRRRMDTCAISSISAARYNNNCKEQDNHSEFHFIFPFILRYYIDAVFVKNVTFSYLVI
jgi:hypothetical protein